MTEDWKESTVRHPSLRMVEPVRCEAIYVMTRVGRSQVGSADSCAVPLRRFRSTPYPLTHRNGALRYLAAAHHGHRHLANRVLRNGPGIDEMPIRTGGLRSNYNLNARGIVDNDTD